MKSTTQKFSNILKESISPILKEAGFKKKGSNYFKSIGDIGYALNIQKDKRNSKEELKFTINLGIFSPQYWLAELDYEKTGTLPTFPKESESVVRERIGVFKHGKDYWYTIEAQIIERKLIKTVQADLENYVLPFFEKITSIDALRQYLKANQDQSSYDYKLFILTAEAGLKEDAQLLFDKILADSPERYLEQLKDRALRYQLKM